MNIDLNKIKSEKSIKELLVFGIINIDKPSGPTSFSVSDYIRKLLQLSKTSHGGTLDPQVSGVLPIMLGRACRLSEYLMHRDKTYVGILRLHKEVDEGILKEQIKKFIGKIVQVPPVRSRVKRAARIREVKTFSILERDGKDVLFETKVQAGTYIRKICDDLGKELGGAHMLELRRTAAGLFTEPSYTLYELEKAVQEYQKGNESLLRSMLVPGEIVTALLPSFEIKEEYVKKCLRGSPIFKEYLKKISSLEKDEKITILSGEKFIGCYRVVNEGNVFAVPEFVLN